MANNQHEFIILKQHRHLNGDQMHGLDTDFEQKVLATSPPVEEHDSTAHTRLRPLKIVDCINVA